MLGLRGGGVRQGDCVVSDRVAKDGACQKYGVSLMEIWIKICDIWRKF